MTFFKAGSVKGIRINSGIRRWAACGVLLSAGWLAACNTTSPGSTPNVVFAPVSQSVQVTDVARNRARIRTELGALYFQRGEFAVAIDELKNAISIDSAYAPAYNVLGLVYMSMGEHARSEEYFLQALSVAAGDPEVNNNYGWFLCQRGRFSDAQARFATAYRNPLYPVPDRALSNAGVCAVRMGDLKQAEALLDAAIRASYGRNPEPHLARADLMLRLERLDEARRSLGDFHQLVEPSAPSLSLAVRLERKRGDRVAEASYIAQLKRRFPNSEEAKNALSGEKP